jgi:hypothetical protein
VGITSQQDPESIGDQVVKRRDDSLAVATQELAKETRRLRQWTTATVVVTAVGIAVTLLVYLT